MFLAGFLASFLLPGQSIFHIRIDHSRIEKRLIALIRSSGRNSRVIFNSPYLLRSFLEDTATPAGAGRLSVIENSLYPPFSDRPFVDRFKHTGPRLVIGIFGRICPEKGQDIAGALVNACQAVVIHLVGFCDPADREFLDAILQAGGGRITHRDFSDDLPGTVEELGIQASIVPSRWNEAFGLVAIESMAMSLITFVSDRGMLPEIAAATGALCHESPQRLIEQVAEVCGMNYESRRELARVQHQAAVARYNFNRFAADVTRLLQEK
jgi:glycosyltransferase involved in cell wall biosynthesis